MGVRRGLIPLDAFGVHFNTRTPDADGATWMARFESGWDSAEHRGDTLDPTGQHGAVAGPQLAGGRRLVLDCSATAPTAAAAWAAHGRVTSAMPARGSESTLILHEPTPKQLTVIRYGSPRADEPEGNGYEFRFGFKLVLLAEYPFKRALTPVPVPTILAGTSQTFTLGGNVPAELEVELLTAGTFSLTSAGSTMAMGSTVLPAGTVIRTVDHSVTDAAGNDLGTMPGGFVWLAGVPGSNTLANGGTANVAVTVYDTFD